MEVQLDGLIERLRKDGIEEGKEKASQIVREAEQRAAQIVADAQEKAQGILAEAEKQAARFKANGELALKYALRDAELLLKSRVTELFDRVFRRRVVETLTPDCLKELIGKLVDAWSKNAEVEVALHPRDVERLEAVLFQGLRESLKDTVVLKPAPEIAAGFRIGLKGDDVYYDFTDESIAETLRRFINPRLREILDGKDG